MIRENMNAPGKYTIVNTKEKRIPLSGRDILLAVLSGFTLTASFPPGKLSFLAWFALVPLLKSLDNKSPSPAFRLGLVTGMAHYLTLLYWIVVVLGHYGNLNIVVSFVILILLCLYLALYPAIFSSLSTYLGGYRLDLIFMAGFWVGLEYIRSKILTGFPWCFLGHTQYEHLYVIQIADICGVYGLSFLIILANGIIYWLLFMQNERRSSLLKWQILIAVLMAGSTFAYGHYRLSEERSVKQSGQSVNTVIIQGNIDQSVKWDPAYQEKTMNTYLRLTRTVLDFSPGLIVWPETALPFFFQDNVKFSPRVLSLAMESRAPLIFGSPAYKRVSGMTRYYNRAYLLTPDNQPIKYYDKAHLVPFGEYVPLGRFLTFVNRLVPAAGDFDVGDKIIPLKHEGLSAGVLICFEVIFPELARAHARKGANILVNLTNDAWFGMTSAPYQHLSMAVFRSVENRLPTIRAANTGFSAFISPRGEILAQSDLFTEAVLKAPVDISESTLPLYARYGDMFALSLLFISLIKIFYCLWRRKGK
ncbi:MAG: apolipoprotein N-acyltransferase [Deltaproteobacteria bacterium]|nr:apolipoprotein N-acyltransferase [Deltaproteobacteria bacterium]MBW2344523.1 apolipoprotein N-acyltransferase [Deltaproteobacteria bacterium]